VEAGFDGAARDGEQTSDFVVREAVELAEDQDGAGIFGELVEGGVKVEAGVGAGDGVGRFAGEIFVERADRLAELAAKHGGLAEENRIEPGLDAGTFLERGERPEGGGEGFLEKIFGIVLGGHEGRREAEHGGRVAIDEAMKGLLLAGPGLPEQLDVGWFHFSTADETRSHEDTKDHEVIGSNIPDFVGSFAWECGF
jgi:hypothetical protein